MRTDLQSSFTPEPGKPLLLFGGPYSNLEALQALFERARELDIPDANLLCTGDLVAYCADAQAVVDEIRARDIAVVQGNCEASLGMRGADCGCGFQPGSACDLLSGQWYRYAMAALDDESRAWMQDLPPLLAFQWAGWRWAALHGGLRQNNRFLFASDNDATLNAEIPGDADIVIAGHCGIPFTRVVGERLWHNAGVIGMPANDGTPRGWYSVAQTCAQELVLTHHALHYDALAANRKMLQRGLTGYADALLSGLWPSLDVLPPAEREATGQPLTFEPVCWSTHRCQACA